MLVSWQHLPNNFSELLVGFNHALDHCGPCMSGNPALSLYRSFIRAASHVKAAPVRRKAIFNLREALEVRRTETSPERIQEQLEDGISALRIVVWLSQLPEVGAVRCRAHITDAGASRA